MHVIAFWIGILCVIFQLVSGITLTSPSDFMSTTGFSLVCDVQGSITTLVRVNDPLGNIAASCFPPPSPCGSGAGNTFSRNISAGTFTVNVIQSNVHTTNSVGNWSCTDGSQVAHFPVNEIVSVTEPKISTASNSAVDGSTVTVQIDCIYPYPDEIKIEYIKESDQTFLKRATAVTFVNGTASNCPVSDARAISVTGTLTVSRKGLGEHAAKIKATLLLRGKEMISGLSDFTIASTCTGSFHCGFWPVLLIVVVACVIIWILVWKKDLKIGGFCQRKEINIAIFNGVPIIVALVIGVILGIVMKCIICVTAVGVSIGVGLFIVVVLLIFIIVWNCKKEFYRAVINITSVSYTDDLGDCKSEAYKNLSHRVIKAIEFLYKNVEGQQTVMEINFSPGLMVTFDLSSQGFSDCSVLSDTLKNALQKGDISSFNVSSVGFEFMPLQDWKDSKGETSDRSNGDRARSPASASAVKVEAENKSHIKPTGKKTEESSLHIKSYGSPLPEVPKVRHNQLDPIGEMDNKPYTKLYGSPLPEVPQVRSNQLDRIERQDIDEVESPKVEKRKKKKKKNRKKNEDSVDNEEDN